MQERYAFQEGDRQRGKNQMEVIRGVVKKALSPEILTSYSSILSSLDGCFGTNITYEEIAQILQQQLTNGWRLDNRFLQCRRNRCYREAIFHEPEGIRYGSELRHSK